MKIPLEDPIWTRLYGPYGVQSVNEDIADLLKKWDTEKANDLYWEKLHHQDDIYPVTYAALPWLWENQPDALDQKIDLFCFVSHIVSCSVLSEYSTAPSGKFSGLSVEPQHHHHSWLPKQARLLKDDQTTLSTLEDWFERNQNDMATHCLDATADVDGSTAVHLCKGYLSLGDCETISLAMGLWQNGEKTPDILEEAMPSIAEIPPTKALLSRLKDKDGSLTTFLMDWLSECDVASFDHPNQMKLI